MLAQPACVCHPGPRRSRGPTDYLYVRDCDPDVTVQRAACCVLRAAPKCRRDWCLTPLPRMLSCMRWFRQSSGWRDAECLTAAIVACTGALVAGLTRLPAACVPRCSLKTWTNVPCFTCGGTRAMDALLHGHVAAAFRLQPLLTGLALAAVVWVSYAVTGALFGLSRVRVQATRHEQIIIAVVVAMLVLANWVYLIMDGR